MALHIAKDCNNYKLGYLESGILLYTQNCFPQLHMTTHFNEIYQCEIHSNPNLQWESTAYLWVDRMG